MAGREEHRRPRSYPALATFLDGYMHQDFRRAYGSAKGAAEAFARDADPAQVGRTAEDLRKLVEALEKAPLAEWRAALLAVGGSWRPSSIAGVRGLLGVLHAAAAEPGRANAE